MPQCPRCRETRWTYRRDALLHGLIAPLTGHLPYECASCGWRGWWAPPNGHPTVISIVGSFIARVAPSLVQRLRALEARLTQLKLPVSPAALKGAALLGLLAGIIAALIALNAASPSETVAVDISLPPPVDAQAQPVPVTSQPTPEAVPVALTTPAPEPPALAPEPPALDPAPAAPPAAPTTGVVASTVALSAPRPQAPTSARVTGYRGGLRIESDPAGARVLIDGEEVGVTPLQLKNLPVGSRVVRVEAEGYATWTTAARVVANQHARVSAVLQRSSQR